jgi:hypothetical protein
MTSAPHADADVPSRRREFKDSKGRQWTVRQVMMNYDRRSAAVLLFENPEIIRVVRNFPENWYAWEDAKLEELSERL